MTEEEILIRAREAAICAIRSLNLVRTNQTDGSKSLDRWTDHCRKGSFDNSSIVTAAKQALLGVSTPLSEVRNARGSNFETPAPTPNILKKAIEAIEAIKELVVADKMYLCWKTADDTIQFLREEMEATPDRFAESFAHAREASAKAASAAIKARALSGEPKSAGDYAAVAYHAIHNLTPDSDALLHQGAAFARHRALGFAEGIEAAAARIEELGVNRDGTLDPVAKAVAANVRKLAKENSNDRP